jgi:hypothetical protein
MSFGISSPAKKANLVGKYVAAAGKVTDTTD